jgi:thioredoxin 1
MIQKFTDQNFNQNVLKSKKPVLVDFWAPWCGPCLQISPVIDALEAEIGSLVNIGKINVDENKNITSQYKIKSIPNIKIFSKGEVVAEFIGVKDINLIVLKEALEKLLG